MMHMSELIPVPKNNPQTGAVSEKRSTYDMKHILIADDDSAFLRHLSELVGMLDERYRVYTAENGEKALALIEKQPIDLLITDLRMPVMDGLELIRRASANRPSMPVILMSACANAEMLDGLGPLRKFFFDKPLNFNELVEMMRRLMP